MSSDPITCLASAVHSDSCQPRHRISHHTLTRHTRAVTEITSSEYTKAFQPALYPHADMHTGWHRRMPGRHHCPTSTWSSSRRALRTRIRLLTTGGTDDQSSGSATSHTP